MSRLSVELKPKQQPKPGPKPLPEPEQAVRDFFDRYAEYYERSWDLKAHGLHVGIFEHPADPPEPGVLEDAYQRSRDHVAGLLAKVRPLSSASRVLDVCCGTGATLSQIVEGTGCSGVGVDISPAQIELAIHLRLEDPSARRKELTFLEGSASTINEITGDMEPFSHVFSQEGLLFVQDRRKALTGLYEALEPGGALVISDFVPRVSREEMAPETRARVYDDAKWKGGMSFQDYLNLLEDVGFELIQSELRPADMRATYAALAPRTRALAQGSDADTYAFLAKRYDGIVSAVDSRQLTWGWFVARKG